MQIDKHPFFINTLKLNSKVLIRSYQADTTKGKNVIIGEEVSISSIEKGTSTKVVLEKSSDG